MTISRAQMNRQLYQMGGIGTLPMDFGQPLQVSQSMMNPSFGPMQSMMNNPMSNYGQTPLTMAGGGITRLGYQEGGMDQMMMEPQMQEQMMQPQMQEQMMQAPMQDQMQGQMMQQAPQIDPSQMDPKQALEIIIQMLIAQGIPPEEAKEIAIQMVQAVAEGGMGEMEDQRIEARFGGMMSNGREQYGLGSFFKGVGKAVSGAVKGVTNAVKSIVKSDLGKAALAAAAIYASGGGALFGGPGFGSAGTLFGPGGTLGGTTGLFGGADLVGGTQTFFGGPLGFGGSFAPTAGTFGSLFSTASNLLPSMDTLKTFGLGTLAGKFLGGGEPKREDFGSDEEHQAAVARYKEQFQTALNNPNPQFAGGLFPNNPFYPQRAANGGRIGYQGGGIGDLISQVTKEEFFGRPMMAMGGEIPMRKNEAGVTELDYRQSGGFVPPIGIKEKADDIPAMLSNNEFVFTADAVRAAGGGSVNKGAQRMYGLMKQLESGIA